MATRQKRARARTRFLWRNDREEYGFVAVSVGRPVGVMPSPCSASGRCWSQDTAAPCQNWQAHYEARRGPRGSLANFGKKAAVSCDQHLLLPAIERHAT